MITVDITPARRRFSNRKQWKFVVRAANNKRIDPRDTYANPGDIFSALHALLLTDEVRVRTHYDSGVEVQILRRAVTE
jgi:hypothetical protein